MMCGGTGEEKNADEEIQALIEKVRSDVQSKLTNTGLYKAVSYKTQVVAGTNFFVKVKIGDGEYVHLRIFRPLPPNHEKPEVHGVRTGLGESDALDFFESN